MRAAERPQPTPPDAAPVATPAPDATPAADATPAPASSRRRRWLRLALLAALLATPIVLRYTTAAGAALTTASLRTRLAHAGGAGFALFVAAFTLGELMHLPGMLFVAAAVLAWGRLGGGLAALGAALVSLSVSFAIVRAVGGQPLGELRHPRLRALVGRLEARPIATVALLRLVLWLAPSLNYALALSRVRYRDYLVGSALGLVVPLGVAAALFGVVFH